MPLRRKKIFRPLSPTPTKIYVRPGLHTAPEHELLAQAYAMTAGNITQMAQLLGWSRLTVREKPRQLGLDSAAADH